MSIEKKAERFAGIFLATCLVSSSLSCGGRPSVRGPFSAAPVASQTFAEPAEKKVRSSESPASPEALRDPPLEPPTITAPFARTTKPGDGRWSPVVKTAEGVPVIFRTDIHPHPVKSHVYVVLVAIDLRALDLELVAGTREPKSMSVPAERRNGLVPKEDEPLLAALFNGGFMTQHGAFGMGIGDDLFAPAHGDGCAVVKQGDGSLRIGPWGSLAGDSMAFFRQTPPCLLHEGRLHPLLAHESETTKWGAAVGGKVEVRRSAVALSADSRTLFFALGDWVRPRDLATALALTGAQEAAQLDINWSYTRFLLWRTSSNEPALDPPEALIEKMKFRKGEYVTSPAERDFFYLRFRRANQ